MGSVVGKESAKEPAFTVMPKSNPAADYEIRKYPSFEKVGVEMDGKRNNFMTLAGYIGVMGEA